MPYEVLERKLHTIPEQYFEQISSFLDIIINLINVQPQQTELETPSPIKIGLGKGKFKVPDDIHYGDDDIAEIFKDYI